LKRASGVVAGSPLCAPDPLGHRNGDSDASGHVAVVDVGSNTVRLVVYDTPTRLPVPMYNEKAQCELVRGMAATGRLNPEGVELALSSLARFVHLAGAMGVEHMRVVATAAVRDAEDGPAFVEAIETLHGLTVTVLSGADEAQLAALGVLSGIPRADGVLMDLGGGSCDLVGLDEGRFGESATLPLGHLRLAEAAGNDRKKGLRLVEKHLADVPWIADAAGRAVYACGGSMRALARVFIDQTSYPLHVIDQYAVDAGEALRLSDLIARSSLGALEGIPGISRRRKMTLSHAATVMSALIRTAEPATVVFSGFGMREGQLLSMLPSDVRVQDPLLSACESLAERTGRFSISGAAIVAWSAPLFPNETADHERLRTAIALLSDIGWPEHPDYRAEHAFHRVLRIPFAGLSHPERVFAALAVYIRYNGDIGDAVTTPVMRLLPEDDLQRVRVLGLALRLAHTISGSAPGILERTALSMTQASLTLTVPKDKHGFASETVERRLKTLARQVDRRPRIVARRG
jgi:exopolyphosphatase/guanosine-5'-triphosphate,3'-diphosphate pyrophosphatase